jgi:hypothetical protein
LTTVVFVDCVVAWELVCSSETFPYSPDPPFCLRPLGVVTRPSHGELPSNPVLSDRTQLAGIVHVVDFL